MKKKILIELDTKYIDLYGTDLNNTIEDLIAIDYNEKQDYFDTMNRIEIDNFDDFMNIGTMTQEQHRSDRHNRII